MFATLTQPMIRRLPGIWVVRAGGAVLGETASALELTEPNGLTHVYFPEADLALPFFERNARREASVFGGGLQYFDLIAKSGPLVNAAWQHEAPEGVGERLAGHLCFDTLRVAVEHL